MALMEPFVSTPPPLRRDDSGTVRVGGTRVTLDTVIHTFDNGCTPEEILLKYPSLSLTDIYAVVTYYLQHQDEVRLYLEQRHREAEQIRQDIDTHLPADKSLRERLLARQAQKQHAQRS